MKPRVRGTATVTLDVIKWTGWGFFIIGVLGTATGLATIPFLGYAPENPWAEGSLNFAFPGLCVPFACAIAHGILSSVFVTEESNWLSPVAPKQKLFLLAVTLPFIALILVILGLGSIPLFQFVPDDVIFDDNIGDIIGAVMIGLLLFALIVSAVVGGLVMAGKRGGLVGLVLGFGFTALAYGLINNNRLWTVLGVLGLAFSIAGFYFLGARAESLPQLFRTHYGTWIAVITGVVMGVWGALTGNFWITAVGVFTIAAWVGIRLAVRQPSQPTQETVESHQTRAGHDEN